MSSPQAVSRKAERFSAGSCSSNCRETGQPGKVVGALFRRLTDYRPLQTAADAFGDLPKGPAFFGHAVITGPCSPFFQGEPEQMASIEPVHCRPAVEPLA